MKDQDQEYEKQKDILKQIRYEYQIRTWEES
jgi:hypothetical protein